MFETNNYYQIFGMNSDWTIKTIREKLKDLAALNQANSSRKFASSECKAAVKKEATLIDKALKGPFKNEKTKNKSDSQRNG